MTSQHQRETNKEQQANSKKKEKNTLNRLQTHTFITRIPFPNTYKRHIIF